MNKELKYEEFFFRRENRIVNIKELSSDNYLIYKSDMFCPECHKAELYYVANTNKIPHLRTIRNSIHSKNCSYGYPIVSTKTAKKYFTNLSDEQIKNKLNSMMRYLCTEKNKRSEDYSEDINNHPMLIRTQEIEKTRNFQQLKRKSLNAFFNEDDEAKLYVFYGKVQLKLEIKDKEIRHKETGYKDKIYYAFLYLFCKDKKKFYIYFPKSQIPKDVKNGEEYYMVAIGEIKRREKIFQPPFKIDLLNENCIKYQKC